MTKSRKVGKTTIKPKYTATCHCGQVEWLLNLPNGLINPQYFDCSICNKRSAVAISVNLDDLTVIEGESLTLYQCNTRTATHYFRSICGIYTHHQRRSNPHQYGVNLACLDDVTMADLITNGVEIAITNGQTHPKDRH